jgi:hypothetical protein
MASTQVHVRGSTIELLVKFAFGMFFLHLGAAIVSSYFQLALYQQLTATEAMLFQNFLNWLFQVLDQIWRSLVHIIYGMGV